MRCEAITTHIFHGWSPGRRPAVPDAPQKNPHTTTIPHTETPQRRTEPMPPDGCCIIGAGAGAACTGAGGGAGLAAGLDGAERAGEEVRELRTGQRTEGTPKEQSKNDVGEESVILKPNTEANHPRRAGQRQQKQARATWRDTGEMVDNTQGATSRQANRPMEICGRRFVLSEPAAAICWSRVGACVIDKSGLSLPSHTTTEFTLSPFHPGCAARREAPSLRFLVHAWDDHTPCNALVVGSAAPRPFEFKCPRPDVAVWPARVCGQCGCPCHPASPRHH